MLHGARFAGGIAASGQNAGFGGNLFTRDACRMILDVMAPYPWLAREMLGVLPQEQGIQHDSSTNEFPDALPHQVFREVVGGRYAPSAQVEAVERWAGIWGVPLRTDPTGARTLVIFNSSDAPLLYLISLSAFCRLPGGRIVLGDRFIHRPTGEVRTVAEAARRCVAFVMRALSTARDSGLDLYAVPNTNPRQTSPSGVMRDGFDAYYRPGGGQDEPLDYSLVAYVENQALLYEALTVAALELFPDDPDAPEWLAAAASVRASTLEQFWIEDWQMFCPAVDRRGPVALHSTAAAELLNGPFLDDLPDAPDYVRTIVEWLYSPAVMTPIGPRMLSLRHAANEGDYYSYQGTGAVWSVTNGIIAKGLGHWGLHPLRRELGIDRLLAWFNRSGEAVELAYVHRETNEPCYDPYPPLHTRTDDTLVIAAAELGQIDQGWGASAALAEIWADELGAPEPVSGSWQRALCRRMLARAREIPPAVAGLPERAVYVDLRTGQHLAKERARQLGVQR